MKTLKSKNSVIAILSSFLLAAQLYFSLCTREDINVRVQQNMFAKKFQILKT